MWLSCGRRDRRRVACVWLDGCVTEMRESSLCGPLSDCPPCLSEELLVHRVDTGEPVTVRSLEMVPCPLGTLTSRVVLFWQRYGIRTPQSIQLFGPLGCVVYSEARNPRRGPKGKYPAPCCLCCDGDLGPPHSLKRQDLVCFLGWEFRPQELVR